MLVVVDRDLRVLAGYRNAGMINFDTGIIPADTTVQLSWRISDHFPLWCEFQVPGS